MSHEKLLRYLSHFSGTSRQKALRNGKSVRTKQWHMQELLHRYCEATPWPPSPKGDMVVVPDALLINVRGELWTLYCILIRPVKGNKATITKPLLVPGREGQNRGWYHAFDELPEEISNRIVAMVCDGAQSLVGMARMKGWILQRCCFHLKARFRHNMSIGHLGHNKQNGRKIQYLVDIVVNSTSENEVNFALDALREFMIPGISGSLRNVISGFLKHYEDYRSYVNYPQLRLPRTSNSAESLMSIIRRLQRKAHGFSSTEASFKWIEGLLKYHKTIACNPADSLHN